MLRNLQTRLEQGCTHYNSEITSLSKFFSTACEKFTPDDPFWINSTFCVDRDDVTILFSAVTALAETLANTNHSDPIKQAFCLHDALLRFFFDLLRLDSLNAHVNPFFLASGQLYRPGDGSTTLSASDLEFMELDSHP